MTAARNVTNVAASIRQRLINRARQRDEDFGRMLTQYAIERLLHRLGRSKYVNEFILKGAQLFSLWTKTPHRPTRDLDLLRQGDAAMPKLEAIFREICSVPTETQDGIEFLPATVRTEAIREQAEYNGVRVKIGYHLGGARDVLQIDIGFGDAVVPEAVVVEYPSMLDLPTAKLRAYRRETVVAEKFHAMVLLGMANSRMKDIYDLHALAREFPFDGATLQQAIRATFERRRTAVPDGPPLALSQEFADDSIKKTQWSAFVRRHGLAGQTTELDAILERIRQFVMPITGALTAGGRFDRAWQPGEGWVR